MKKIITTFKDKYVIMYNKFNKNVIKSFFKMI